MLTFDLSVPPVVKLYLGFISQLYSKPKSFKLVFLNEAPIVFSGTATIAFFRPCFLNLSSAINIKALDFPEAGGAFIKRY